MFKLSRFGLFLKFSKYDSLDKNEKRMEIKWKVLIKMKNKKFLNNTIVMCCHQELYFFDLSKEDNMVSNHPLKGGLVFDRISN